jgi:hypothetical protein
MKKLITTFIVAGAVLGLSAVSFSQQAGANGQGTNRKGQKQRQGGRMGRMGKMQQELLAKLNLSDDQKQKVEAQNKKVAEQLKALVAENKDGDRSKLMEKFKSLREENDKALQGILTADQWKKFEVSRKELRKKMRKEQGQKGGGAKGGGN